VPRSEVKEVKSLVVQVGQWIPSRTRKDKYATNVFLLRITTERSSATPGHKDRPETRSNGPELHGEKKKGSILIEGGVKISTRMALEALGPECPP